jgi:cobalt/nickel transport system permease protein
MHIPQHVLDPATCAATGAISAAAISYAAYRVRQESVGQKLPLMALFGGSILAAQAMNYPIAAGASGHCLGGALAGIVLGPWAGMLVMAAVVLVQCVLFGDGGATALGANILNMAVIGSLAGHFVYSRLAARSLDRRGVAAGMAAAWCSVMASAVACSAELSLGAGYPMGTTLVAMMFIHSLIGIGEMALTGAILTGLISGVAAPSPTRVIGLDWRRAALGFACVLVGAAVFITFS